MILVFTNKSAVVGPGLDVHLTPEEKKRLMLVMTNVRAEAGLDLGTTVVMAKYFNLAMAAGTFLAEEVLKCPFKTFVNMGGFVDRVNALHRERGGITTLIVNTLSFYPERTPHEAPYPVFWRWWNEHCYLFGMPAITTHDRDGDKAALLIDYEKREVRWLKDIGQMA